MPLPDLRTEAPVVAQGYQTWIKELVSNYSIDGLRLDTVFEVNKGFWSGFRTAAGVYMIGEIDLDDPGWVCSYQDQLPGVLNYGMYFPLVNAFSSTSGSMADLASTIDAWESEGWSTEQSESDRVFVRTEVGDGVRVTALATIARPSAGSDVVVVSVSAGTGCLELPTTR